jgi:hypothetical protein
MSFGGICLGDMTEANFKDVGARFGSGSANLDPGSNLDPVPNSDPGANPDTG